MLLSFVIPCYNSEQSIGWVVDEIIKTVIKREYDYEIILVNDSSKDNTYKVIKSMAEQNKKIKVINFSQNFGQHSALMAAYRMVSGQIVVGLDDDGEHHPKDLFKLIDKLNEGYDYVCAKHPEKKHTIVQNIGSKINDKMATILIDKPKDIYFSSYYVMRRFVVDEIVKYENPYPYVGGLLLRVTKNLGDVEIEHQKRLVGQSGYNFRKMFGLWFNGFTAFSIKPLRIATVTGMGLAAGGFIYAIYIIIQKLINPNVPVGWSSMMSGLLIIGGLIMIMLGLIGEYIGRIYISINNSPQYVIRETINFESEKRIYEEKNLS